MTVVARVVSEGMMYKLVYPRADRSMSMDSIT